MPRRFVFKLEGVLEYRRALEEKKKRELAQVQREVGEATQQLMAMLRLEVEEKERFRKMKAGELNIVTLRLQEAYLNNLIRKIGQQQQLIQKLRTKQVNARAEYVEARKQVMLLERLKERQRERWRYEANREEVRFLDEIGANIHRIAEDRA